MKLIILHNYSDGCTFWGTDTIPIERESEEALICELEDWAKQGDTTSYEGWCGTGIHDSTVLGTNEYNSIEIVTLDAWFASKLVGGMK